MIKLGAKGIVGHKDVADGVRLPVRFDKTGALVVSHLHGDDFENAFTGAIRDADFVRKEDPGTNTLGGIDPLATIGTTSPFTLINLPNSGRVALVNYVMVSYVSGTLGAGCLCLTTINQPLATLAPAFFEPRKGGYSRAMKGIYQSTATVTLPVTPYILRPLASMGVYAGTEWLTPRLIYEIKGGIVLPPGYPLCVQAQSTTGTTPRLSVSFSWDEVPL